MFAWARLRPQDGPRAAPALSGNRLARLALEHGVWLAPGSLRARRGRLAMDPLQCGHQRCARAVALLRCDARRGAGDASRLSRGTAAASRVRAVADVAGIEVRARVRLLDAGIGHVLEAEAGLELVARPEHRTQAENVAELERGAGAMLVRCIGTAQQARTRADLQEGHEASETMLFQPQQRRETELGHVVAIGAALGNHSASSTSHCRRSSQLSGCPS